MRDVLKTAPICSSDRPFLVRYFKDTVSLTRNRNIKPSGLGQTPVCGNYHPLHNETHHEIKFDMGYANGVRKITWRLLLIIRVFMKQCSKYFWEPGRWWPRSLPFGSAIERSALRVSFIITSNKSIPMRDSHLLHHVEQSDHSRRLLSLHFL